MYFPSLTYFHQLGNTALICAAYRGHSEVIKVLIDAGASIEAKNNVSNRISLFTYVCVFVCVCVWIRLFFHHTVWYDNVIIMNTFTIMMIIVFVFVSIIITPVLLFYLINMMISIVNIFLFIIFLQVSFIPTFSVIIFFFFSYSDFFLFSLLEYLRFHSSVTLLYWLISGSRIFSSCYVGYDNVIIMNNFNIILTYLIIFLCGD